MTNLYRISLILSSTAISLVGALLFFWLSVQPTWINNVTTPILLGASVLTLAGLIAAISLFKKAKRLRSQKNLSKSLKPIALLIINIPLIIITYSVTHYVEITHTITITNNATKPLKKFFFANGTDKYFIKPIEPGQKYTKALIFTQDDKITYTFNIGNKILSGTVFDTVDLSKGAFAKIRVLKTEKVLVELPGGL